MPLLVLYSAVSVSGSPLHVNAEDDNINDMVNHMKTNVFRVMAIPHQIHIPAYHVSIDHMTIFKKVELLP